MRLIDNCIRNEILSGATVGPFVENPPNSDLFISPLNSVPKKVESNRRVILDLSFPHGNL